MRIYDKSSKWTQFRKLTIVAHQLFLMKTYRICNILSTTFSYYLSIISTKAGTPCFHSVPAFFIFTGSVYLLHQSTYSLVTPHRFVRLLFGKTSQNWCSYGVVPQMPLDFHLKIHRICVSILHFTVQSASSWGVWLVVIYSCLQVFISLCLCKIKRSYFSQLYATVYSYSQIGGKSVVRLVVNLFVFVRVPTLQDFFHLPNKLLLVRHI